MNIPAEIDNRQQAVLGARDKEDIFLVYVVFSFGDYRDIVRHSNAVIKCFTAVSLFFPALYFRKYLFTNV